MSTYEQCKGDIRKVYDAGYDDGRNEKDHDPLSHHSVCDVIDQTYDVTRRNAELLEAVKKAHEILLHEMDNGRTPSMLQGVGLGYFEDIICEVNRD